MNSKRASRNVRWVIANGTDPREACFDDGKNSKETCQDACDAQEE